MPYTVILFYIIYECDGVATWGVVGACVKLILEERSFYKKNNFYSSAYSFHFPVRALDSGGVTADAVNSKTINNNAQKTRTVGRPEETKHVRGVQSKIKIANYVKIKTYLSSPTKRNRRSLKTRAQQSPWRSGSDSKTRKSSKRLELVAKEDRTA